MLVPVKNSNRCVKQGLLHLENAFFVKSSIFVLVPWESLKIPWRPQTLGFLGDLQATSPGHHVPAGNLHGKNKYVIHISNLKVALNHRLVLKILHKVIKFNHNFMAKIIHRNEHRVQKKKVKNKSEKDFFTLMNNSDFGKTMENIRKHRDIKFVTTEKRRNYLMFKVFWQQKWRKLKYLWINQPTWVYQY